MEDNKYGVAMVGSGGGRKTVHFETRSDANRVRRVIRAWKATRSWAAHAGHEQIAEFAQTQKFRRTRDILGSISIGIQVRRQAA